MCMHIGTATLQSNRVAFWLPRLWVYLPTAFSRQQNTQFYFLFSASSLVGPFLCWLRDCAAAPVGMVEGRTCCNGLLTLVGSQPSCCVPVPVSEIKSNQCEGRHFHYIACLEHTPLSCAFPVPVPLLTWCKKRCEMRIQANANANANANQRQCQRHWQCQCQEWYGIAIQTIHPCEIGYQYTEYSVHVYCIHRVHHATGMLPTRVRVLQYTCMPVPCMCVFIHPGHPWSMDVHVYVHVYSSNNYVNSMLPS